MSERESAQKMAAHFGASHLAPEGAAAPAPGHDSNAASSAAPAASAASPAARMTKPAAPGEAPKGVAPKTKDRFHEMSQRIAELEQRDQQREAELAEARRRHEDEVRTLREQQGREALLKALSKVAKPDGFDDWSEDQQRQWEATTAAEELLNLRITKSDREALREVLYTDKAQDMIDGLSRAQAKAVAKVAESMESALSEGVAGWREAHAIAQARNPELFAPAADTTEQSEPADEPEQPRGVVFQGQWPGQITRHRPREASAQQEYEAIKAAQRAAAPGDRHAMAGRMIQLLMGR